MKNTKTDPAESAKAFENGNTSDMREVLAKACDIISCYQMSEDDGEFSNQDDRVSEWFAMVDSVLSAPPEPPSNAAAMREALEVFVDHASCLHHCDIHRLFPETTSCDGVLADEGKCPMKPECDAVFKGRAALAAPPRNCDVGTADEQADRFKAFCYANRTPDNECSKECLLNDTSAVVYCQARWAQMPYEEKHQMAGGEL